MKDIKGYEGLYAITSCGKVWSYKSKRFLTPRINDKGYLRVALSKEGQAKDFYIHRLVAMAYIPNPENKPVVNHLDENPLHNYLNNLEWATQKENLNYGTCQQRKSKRVCCVETNEIYDSVKAGALSLNLTSAALVRCLRNEKYTCGGYHWKYYDELPTQMVDI